MKDLLRIDCLEGGPIYVPAEQLHSLHPHPSRPEYTHVLWCAPGSEEPSQCTVGVDVDEFAQQLERSCPSVRIHRVD